MSFTLLLSEWALSLDVPKSGLFLLFPSCFPFGKYFVGRGLFMLFGLLMRLRLDACSCASLCRFLGGYIVDERVDESPLSYFAFATWPALSVCGLPERHVDQYMVV